MFALARTFTGQNTQANSQRGFPAPGAGQQTTGQARPGGGGGGFWQPKIPTKGRRSWLNPGAPAESQRGFADPFDPMQAFAAGSMPGLVQAQGATPDFQQTPYYSMPDAGLAPQFGVVTYNPIGAGVVVSDPFVAESGPAATYDNGAIWWTSQDIPTSLNLQGLTDPAALAAILGPVYIQAVYPTTG